MQTKRRDLFTTVRTEGAILPADLLQRIADGDRRLEGLTPEDFHRAGERLNEVINAAWNRLLGQWQTFQSALAKLPESDPATTATRERWLLPLFRELDYGRLTAATAIEIDGKSYPVSHAWQNAPLHLVGWRVDLDRRTAGVAGAARTSPHSMVQKLLNRSEDRLWGFVSNGRRLRILRDNVSLTRQAFVEFDLEAMLDGEVYADFALLWLLCHQSRVEGTASKESAVGEDSAGAAPHPSSVIPHPSTCWLEKWSRTAQQTGTRALDTLRKGVEDAIVALGRGFVAHPANAALRDKLRRGGADGGLNAQDYYRQVLRMVYRLLFLFVAEDRGLLLAPSADESTRERFARFYSTLRLRHLAERHRGTRHCDLFQGLALVMQRLGTADGCPELGLPALGSFLWSDAATPDLSSCRISNADFLEAIRALAFTVDGHVLRAVDYRNLGAEELGSVYESLLELHPKINADAGSFELDVAAGHERKTTGSYYTPTSLITCLLDSAFDPVVDDRLKEADRLAAGKWKTDAEQREALRIVCRAPWDGSPIRPSDSAPTLEPAPAQLAAEAAASYIATRTPHWDKTPPAIRYARLAEHALLGMKICDPACGSGHFLIAAAHRLAKRLAAVRTGDEEPAPDALRHALRDVISHCIYGVDINPMAVELCKINLWLESLEPGKPLSFLDHHIQCGNSLLGATPALLAKGIPDEAFTPIEGDEKTVCSQLKKENRRERQDYASGQGYLFEPPIMRGNIAAEFAKLTADSEDTALDVVSKEERYARLIRSVDYETARLWADTWCSVFVWKKDKSDLGRLCPTERKFRDIERNPQNVVPIVRTEIKRLRDQYQFLHWHLAFPDVFRLPGDGAEPENTQTKWSGGFTVMLGNPPWDEMRPEERKFFGPIVPGIALIENSAKREQAIIELANSDPKSWLAWQNHRRVILAGAGFLHQAAYLPFSSCGNLSTANLFIELSAQLLAGASRAGMIVPSGLATNKGTSRLLDHLMSSHLLLSLFDFENLKVFFPEVHASMRFSLITLGRVSGSPSVARFGFYLHQTTDILDHQRVFPLTTDDIAHVNPSSRTCPVFRNNVSARLVTGIHRAYPIIGSDKGPESWNVTTSSMFQMSHEADELFSDPAEIEMPQILLEGKMVSQFNYRAASICVNRENEARQAQSVPSDETQLRSPLFAVRPQYWVRTASVDRKLRDKWLRPWLMHFCAVTSPTNERTCLACISPRIGAGHSLFQVFSDAPQTDCLCLLANLNAFSLDFVLREKMGGINLSHFIFQQLPVINRSQYGMLCAWDGKSSANRWVAGHVLELTYAAWDLEPFARDCGYDGPPWRWDDSRRFLLRCELDAAYFHLYGIERGDVDYIMDTFPIVRRKDEQAHGEYRTKRVILEIYDAMAEAIRSGRPYQTLLDPPPGPPAGGLPDWQPGQPRPADWPSHIHPPRHAAAGPDPASTSCGTIKH